MSDLGRFSSVTAPIDGGAVLLRLRRRTRHITLPSVARPAHSEEEQAEALGIVDFNNTEPLPDNHDRRLFETLRSPSRTAEAYQ
jgi:hypothetical protein